jgi:hypothetical protein
VQLVNLPAEQISQQLQQADAIEDYLRDLRALALQMLDNGQPVPGYKLVAKRATRQWVEEAKIEAWVDANNIKDAYEPVKIKSPAQLEKTLKKAKIEFPAEMVVAISSGDTLAPESDPRPAVLQIGKQLTAALSKLQ